MNGEAAVSQLLPRPLPRLRDLCESSGGFVEL